MKCPRLDHFIRLNSNGTFSRCGHMVNAPEFDNLEQLESSQWLAEIRQKFESNVWPNECVRCQTTEDKTQNSIRINSIRFDSEQTSDDYLQVGGALDNLCNGGCFSCNPGYSTRIGSLYGKEFPVFNNVEKFFTLPQERIYHLDISGGEPSYSKNYKKLLKNLPPNLKTLRLNTNCSTVLYELTDVVNRGIEVTVTVSLDGIGEVYNLVRWPVIWDEFYKNLMIYKTMPVYLNLWTTVSVLNVDDLPNIIAFAKEHNIDHDYAYLEGPPQLSVKNKGTPESLEFIKKQKLLRGII